MSRQKGKGKKRKRSWHRGGVESTKWQKVFESLPATEATADLRLGTPLPLRRNVRNQNIGDAC